MNRRYLVALSVLIAFAIAACAGGVTETPPVLLTTPQGSRVEALAMTTARANAAAIRLRNGRVLICGGTATGQVGGVLSSAELYDPVARTFTATGSMTVPRSGQTITMLRDGRVLLTGGVQGRSLRGGGPIQLVHLVVSPSM